MSQNWCDAACFVAELANTASDVIGGGVYLVRVILGGLVLWVFLIIARYLVKHSSFRGRGGRR